MGFFNAFANIPIPKGKMNRFPLDSDTCTTSDYLRYKVVFSRLYSPNCKWKIDASQFTRLTPMDKPAFANATFENRLFFVPYRCVFKDFTHIVDNTQNEQGVVPSSVTTLTFHSLALALMAQTIEGNPYLIPFQSDSVPAKQEVVDGKYDVSFPFFDETSQKTYLYFYKLTQKGKQILDILISLGYNFPFYIPSNVIGVSLATIEYKTLQIGENMSDVATSTLCCPAGSGFVGLNQYKEQPTCLAFAAALKIYYDYYLSGRGSRTQNGIYIESIIRYMANVNMLGNLESDDTWTDCLNLRAAFKFLTSLYYDDDYFNTASPTYMDTFGTAGSIVVNDVSFTRTPNSTVESHPNNPAQGTVTPHINGSNNSGAAYNLTQYILDTLLATTKYMRRNNIVGWRSLDRYLAHYGVKLDPVVLNRSLYLGKFICDVGIDAIYNQAATEQELLGSYAGIGIGGGKGHFEFESKEFGQLIMISVCKPKVKYYQGLKREMLDKSRFEFFNGSYDNLGMQAVARCEVCNSYAYNMYPNRRSPGAIPLNTQMLPPDPSGLWGFQNRYAHLKQSTNQDILSGDFRFFSTGGPSFEYFHQFRSVGKGYNISNEYVVDDNFRDCRDREQYDRIFANTSGVYDHFVCYFNFKVNMYAPWYKLFDSLDFEEEIHNGQPKVNVQVGGTKF